MAGKVVLIVLIVLGFYMLFTSHGTGDDFDIKDRYY